MAALDLSFNQLTGSIPPSLPNVRTLHLDNNQLTGSIPSSLGQLSALWYLGLSNNQFTGALPMQLAQLTNLRAINIQFNCLSLDDPTSQSVLTTLRNGRATVYDLPQNCHGIQVSLVRCSSPGAYLNPSGLVNEDLIPQPDPAILTHQPVISKGVVADGVTPLVFKIEQPLPTQASYHVTVNNAALSSHIHVLNGGAWSDSPTVTFDGTNKTGFACIDGLTPEYEFAPGQRELSVTLTLTNTHDPSDVSTKLFYVRRPPIVLVHGYYADNSTWSSLFLSELSAATFYDPSDPATPFVDKPDSFIRRISYGADGLWPGVYFNTWGSLSALARELNRVLSREEDYLHNSWAFTRYDVVAHSQGGILTRMLCAQNVSPITFQFKGPRNFNRGRFRRVITIGSPHNGTTFVHYLRRLQLSRDLYRLIPDVLGASRLLQPKLDPFGEQIAGGVAGGKQIVGINDNRTTVDPDAKFRTITATIMRGDVPPGNRPLAYFWTGLTQPSATQHGKTRGEVVLSPGSDGVVDIESEKGGVGTPSTPMRGIDICHAPPFGLFYVNDDESETRSWQVAVMAANLLTGSDSNFGRFQLPSNLTNKATIEAEVPRLLLLDIIHPIFRTAAAPNTNGQTSYGFVLTPNPAEPRQGQANWYAEVFGPKGVTGDGLIVTPDPSDSTRVTVTVDSSVRGDVVLYAAYNSTTGHLVVGRPFLVVSIPPGANLTGIELQPAEITATISDIINLEIWGKYNNGSRSLLFVRPGTATFSSSNTNVASVVARTGQLTARGQGDATLTATYAGFTGHTTTHVEPPPVIEPSHLGNISTRGFVQTLDNVMIGGFIIQGNEPKTVIVRAIGPELTPFGVPNALANPTLELHNGTGAKIASNDNWQTTIIGGVIGSNQVSAIQGSGHAPRDGRESTIIATLPPGNYTAIVRGVNNTTGVALVEVYDLSPATNSILDNISTRDFVQTGDNVMIGGFIVEGNIGSKKVIVRAIGPELTPFGVPNALADPTLELHDSTGALIASNDNWQTTHIGGVITGNQVSDIQSSGHAPTQASECAIVADLPPGDYTAIVRGKNNATGVALVEVYDLN